MDLTLYSLLCFLIPDTVWLAAHRKKLDGKPHVLHHVVWSFVFILYCYTAVQDAACIGTVWDLLADGVSFDRINLIPFSSAGVTTYALNVLMFMPLGFLLPLIWEEYRTMRRVTTLALAMSLTIELCQLGNARVSDVDDLLMNALGAFLGYCCWVLFKRMFPKAGNRAAAICLSEPAVYIFLGTAGIVLLYNYRWLR